jgi:hypothetical protein
METPRGLTDEIARCKPVLIPAGKAPFGSAEVLRMDGPRGIVLVLTGEQRLWPCAGAPGSGTLARDGG